MKNKFLDLNEDIQSKVCKSPQAVFSTLDPDDETSEQVIERQEKFLKLPEAIKDKLVSHETAEKIKAIGSHYNLELLQMAPIARVIRSYYFGEVQLDDFENIIEKESKISKADAQNIARYVKDRIISRDVKRIEPIKIEKMLISRAMEIYPEIKNQRITVSSIDLEGEAVAPTVANWIADYYNLVGAGNKDIMKRSSYLYHSKNAKGLSSPDRQRLVAIIKSIDEGAPVKVMTEKKEIIFDIVATDENVPRANMGGISKNMGGVVMPKNQEAPQAESVPAQTVEQTTQEVAEKSFSLRNNGEKNIDENNANTVIKHVQGNNWDLGSAHFAEKKEEEGKKNWGFFLGNKKRDDFDKSNGGSQDGLKFSSPQQLPVEKEKDDMIPNLRSEPTQRTAINPKSDFFGKIKPLE